MPRMYQIVKRDNAACRLWRLPDRKLVWATQPELENFAHGLNIGILGERYGRDHIFRGRELIDAAQGLYSGDDLTKLLSDNENGRAVAVETPVAKWFGLWAKS